MEFKSTFFAIVVFSMIIIAASIIVDQKGVAYGSNVTSDLGGDFDKLNEVSGTAETQKGNINPQSGEASSDYEAETFRGGYGIITSLFSPFRVIFGENGMIQSIGDRFGIPSYILQGLIVMFIFAITFGIIAIIFRLGRTSA